MKYLVMETHPAYAVLLDEEGRFLKAANLNYQVGDTVQNVVELRSPAHEKKKKYLIRQIAAVAAAAACFCLVFFGYYQPNFVAYGTIRIQINPEVEMTLSRTERVLDLKGLNADGEDLIREYDYSGKDREDVTHELIRRAMDMGYLSNGDSVSISIDSTDTEWKLREEEGMRSQMEEEYGTQIVIYIGEDVAPDQNSVDESIQVVIPTAPAAEPMPDQEAGESDYSGDGTDDGASDYDSSDTDDGVSDYGSDDADDGISDYSVENTAGDAGEPATDPQTLPVQEDGDSGYDDSSDDGGDDGDSGYDDSGDDGGDDGDSGYDNDDDDD